MLTITNTTTILSFCITLTACANLNTKEIYNNGKAQWDFDHHVQFIQTQLKKNSFHLEIIPNNKVKFKQLATFLLRKSFSLCGSYHYKLELIQGIESYDDKRAMPNYIFPSLMAIVECKPKQNKESS